MKATLKRCAAMLRKHHGKPCVAAKELGMSHQAMYQRIHAHPELEEVVEEAKEMYDEQVMELAKTALIENLKANDQRAVEFVLECRGKDQGWVKKPDNMAIAIATLMDPAAAAAMIEG